MRFAGFSERRLGSSVDPEQVTPLNDVVDGLAELVRVLTEPGDGVIINPPVYHPFFSLIEQAGGRWSVSRWPRARRSTSRGSTAPSPPGPGR